MAQFNLDGKVAIITGGSRGIGRAIAQRLARDGASVVINYVRNKDKATELVNAIADTGSKAIALQADVADPSQVKRLFDQSIQHFGKVDILINSAGIRISKKVVELTEDDFDRLFDINLKGTFFACQQAARRMQSGARIINISTTITRTIVPEYSIYAASKAAVDQITRVLAKELGERHITVNAVAPGSIDTDLFRTDRTAQQIKERLKCPPSAAWVKLMILPMWLLFW